MTTDRITLTGLRVFGYHGVLPRERYNGQDFVIDVALTVDLSAAAASDDLDDTVDYGALAVELAAIVSGEAVDLIETLAVRLADRCTQLPGVELAEVTVHKPKAPIPLSFTDVAVTVVRGRTADREVTAGGAAAVAAGEWDGADERDGAGGQAHPAADAEAGAEARSTP